MIHAQVLFKNAVMINSLYFTQLTKLLLLAAGVLMLLFGLWRGEADTVFSKAIRLCMECVGIG